MPRYDPWSSSPSGASGSGKPGGRGPGSSGASGPSVPSPGSAMVSSGPPRSRSLGSWSASERGSGASPLVAARTSGMRRGSPTGTSGPSGGGSPIGGSSIGGGEGDSSGPGGAGISD